MTKHEKIITFIKAVRDSFPDAAIVYKYGGCYGFYGILKSVFQDAEAYENEVGNHVATLIGGKFYDICGEIPKYIEEEEKFRKITKNEHYIWGSVSSGQRLEFILKKYREANY